jgi:protein SCO1
MRRWWIVSVGAAAVAGVAIGVAFHGRLLGTASAAPLHGQATWEKGARPAPAFTLRDQTGTAVALSSLRGRTVALTFMDSLCRGACPLEGQMLAATAHALPAARRPRIVIVSVDPSGDTPRSTRRALRKWSLPAGTIWLRGTHAQLKKVWDAYQIDVIPVKGDIAHSSAVYLIDKRGGERAGFLMPFAPGAVIDDLNVLGREAA